MERNLIEQNPNASFPAVAPEQPQVHNDVNQHQPVTAPVAAGEPESEEQIDYVARARELEAEKQRIEQENAQMATTLQNVRMWAEQQAAAEEQSKRQAQIQSREQAILDRADTMPSEDARRYIAEEYRKLRDEDAQQWQGQLEQTKRTLARPLYIDNLVKQHGLTDEERQTLLGLENPDDAARMAPYLKAQRQQYSTLQQQIDQLSRTQQANQIQATGIGLVGGQNGPQGNVPLPTNPDEKAAAIYAQLKSGTYQGN